MGLNPKTHKPAKPRTHGFKPKTRKPNPQNRQNRPIWKPTHVGLKTEKPTEVGLGSVLAKNRPKPTHALP